MFEEMNVYCDILERNFTVMVRKPSNRKGQISVLYLNDSNGLLFGDNDESLHLTDHIDELESNGYLENTYIIRFSSELETEHSLAEYSTWENQIDFSIKGQDFKAGSIKPLGEKYLISIMKYIIPLVESTFAINVDRNNRYMLGCSAAGFITHLAGLKYSSMFSKIYCISPTYWYASENLLKLIKATKPDDTKFYIDVGTLEVDPTDANSTIMTSGVAKAMTDNGFDVLYKEIKDAKHAKKDWSDRMSEVLRSIL